MCINFDYINFIVAEMHELFAQVLKKKDLSKAGELFSLEDAEIKGDLSEVLDKICDIASSPEYASSDNDQSVVEICITRVTSAIRWVRTCDEWRILFCVL